MCQVHTGGQTVRLTSMPPPPHALYRRVSGTYRRPDCALHLQGKGYEAIRYDPALDTQLR